MVNPAEVARADYRTAMADLEATDEQALAVAVMAWAWRLTLVSVVGALIALAVAAAVGAISPAGPWLAMVAVSPLVLGFVVSLPFMFSGALHAFRRGGHASRPSRVPAG